MMKKNQSRTHKIIRAAAFLFQNKLFWALLAAAFFLTFEHRIETQTVSSNERRPGADSKTPPMIVHLPGEPEFLAFDGGTARFLASSEETGGAWSLVDEIEPPGSKTPWHRHNYSDQSYYVLEGVLTVKVEDKVYQLPAGSFILIPRGTPHGQANFGKVPVRVLQINTPGGFERILKGRVELLKTMKPDHPDFARKKAELRKTADVELLGVWDLPK